MIKILFVCHGNICRSPMAEFITKHIINEKNKSENFFICSSATSNEEIGNKVYPPAKKELEHHGIFVDPNKKARKLKRKDYDEYDIFVVMDTENFQWAKSILDGDPENKIHRLLEFTGENRDISDPWYSRRFDIAFNEIYKGCNALVEYLLNKEN